MRSILNNQRYMKDYGIERNYPDYPPEYDDECTESEEVYLEDDYIDEF